MDELSFDDKPCTGCNATIEACNVLLLAGSKCCNTCEASGRNSHYGGTR